MSHKLLLADDSITIQKVVGIIFSGEAYDLTVVDNGNDALVRAREAVPDIMLIDALMPGKNGYEVCREARNDHALATVPILLLTGVFEPFDETKARESGADDFISKPFESQVLIDKVKELIALGATRSAASPIAPKVTMASPEEEEILEIEEVSSLDDLWGMDLGEEERSGEIPFGTVIAQEEGESLESVEELEPFVDDEEAPVPPVAYDFTAVPERSGEAFTFDLEPVPPVTVPESDDTTVEEFVFDLEPDEVLPLTEEAEDDEVTVFEEPEIVVESVATLEVPPVVAELFPEVEPVREVIPEPVAAVPPPTPPVIQAPPVAPSVTADGGAVFSEEQLVAALSKVSREVIERIVWEVVPDLAEALIKEEIKKIREGV